MSEHGILVIGAGAAGMMAAGQAAEAGAQVLLLEKMNRPGRKLAITGKGRCNITNTAEVTAFISHFGRNGMFLRQAFARFFNTELQAFLRDIGLEMVTERGGRVFPASGKAPEVVTLLQQWLKQCGVQVRQSAQVEELICREGVVTGVVCQGKEIPARAVILATGGATYPLTGSTGDGYRLAAAVGHSIVPVRPALVPLETTGPVAKMAGLNLRNIRVSLYINNKKRLEEFGELVFAEFGVTGPCILTLSGTAVDALQKGEKVELALDLKPALDEVKLDARLQRDFTSRGGEKISSLLRGLLPGELVPVCLDQLGIQEGRLAGSLAAKERTRLRCWLKEFRLEITGHRPMAEAIVTAGGVDTREIDPRTMASRLVKGLYLAGELLDLQGDTGGYNLQAAFSTGWLAGRSAAGYIQD
jgi:predicted Rossmann fold flavoprotein